jgi:hypothetical protein
VTTCTLARIEAWQAKLLCCRYLTVRFDSVSMCQAGVAATPGFTAVWALGSLSDGTCELLGSWPVSTADTDSWIRVRDDLSARGVERITYLNANGLFHAGSAWSGFLTQFGLPVPARRRRVFRKFDETAQRLGRRVERSVTRRGLFSGPRDAASFVAETLMRAEGALNAAEPLPAKSSRSAHRVTDLYSAVSHR